MLKFQIYSFIGSWPWCFALAYVGHGAGRALGQRSDLPPLFHEFDAVIVAVLLAGFAWFVWSRWREVCRSEAIAAVGSAPSDPRSALAAAHEFRPCRCLNCSAEFANRLGAVALDTPHGCEASATLAMTDSTEHVDHDGSANRGGLSRWRRLRCWRRLLSPAAVALAQNAQPPPPTGRPAQPPAPRRRRRRRHRRSAAYFRRSRRPPSSPASSTRSAAGGTARAAKSTIWPSTRTTQPRAPPRPPGCSAGCRKATKARNPPGCDEGRRAGDQGRRHRLSGCRARVIEVHERCAMAPNGAPDCRTAAANACRAKGFTDGHPVDVQSSENCPPAVWMSGTRAGRRRMSGGNRRPAWPACD